MFDHHGISMTEMRASLAGTGQANCVQQALLANMVRASGNDLGRAIGREREMKGPERRQEERPC